MITGGAIRMILLSFGMRDRLRLRAASSVVGSGRLPSLVLDMCAATQGHPRRDNHTVKTRSFSSYPKNSVETSRGR